MDARHHLTAPLPTTRPRSGSLPACRGTKGTEHPCRLVGKLAWSICVLSKRATEIASLELWKAIILGILQGATEFLPVSSSGHLVLIPWLFGWDESPLIFDVVVHLGTLVAVLLYFWRDWLTLLRAGWTALRTRSTQDPDARLLLLIGLGTVPAALAGLCSNIFESLLRTRHGRVPVGDGPSAHGAERLSTPTAERLTVRDA